MTAERIAHALRGRKSGSRWMCCCPAHKDGRPSLSVRDADGRILVHCFSGCPQNSVIEALKARGLWPETERRSFTPDERRAWGRARARAEAEAEQVELWRIGRLCALYDAKLAAYKTGNWNSTMRIGPKVYQLETALPATLIRMFTDADRGEREADIRWAREYLAAGERLGAQLVARMAEIQFIGWLIVFFRGDGRAVELAKSLMDGREEIKYAA